MEAPERVVVPALVRLEPALSFDQAPELPEVPARPEPVAPNVSKQTHYGFGASTIAGAAAGCAALISAALGN